MLDIRFIRENPDLVRQAVSDRNDTAPIDEILELDTARRKKVGELDALRQERKTLSKQREQAQERGRELRTEIQGLEEEARKLDEQLEDLLLRVPNIPQPDVPVGKNEDENVKVREWGNPPEFSFEALPHWTLGERLDIIDFERGVKISGSRFYVLKGLGARLQRAVITFMLDLHTTEHGYKEIYPPS
ncbi:MAG: serine--tRNA ligase, partial [Dehalococcoidales bacterium]|nr:serine--tRNA ligase [Dehalococcoidales bacterium]